MSDETTTESAESDRTDAGVWARDTAPQTPYTGRQVGIGLVILVIGAAIAFGVPLAMA